MEKTVFVNGQTVITAEFLNYLQDVIEILENSISGGESGSGSVISVNGKSGIVTLTASNVGALPVEADGSAVVMNMLGVHTDTEAGFNLMASGTSEAPVMELGSEQDGEVVIRKVADPVQAADAVNFRSMEAHVSTAISAAVGAADTLLGTGEVTA